MSREYGVVIRTRPDKGFLFIELERESKDEVFAHVNSFGSKEMPKVGDRVEFELVDGPKGFVAENIVNLKNLPNERTNFSVGVGHHFYIVFNPMFNEQEDANYSGETQAHSFNNMLKDYEYLYWGKYRISSAIADLNYEYFMEALEQNKQAGIPTMLYISDFHNFWAAKVVDVSKSLDKEKEGENTLEFYRGKWDDIEIWFKITDMVLVSTRLQDTNHYISKLMISSENTFNTMGKLDRDLSLTPYTSNLRYPLIIQNTYFENYFDEDDARNVHKYNPLLSNTIESEKARFNINKYVIPTTVFDKMPLVVRNEIIMTEVKYRNPVLKAPREYYNKVSEVACDYLRILERSIKDLLMEKYYNQFQHNDFKLERQFTLGNLDYFIRNSVFKTLLKEKSDFYEVLKEINFFVTQNKLVDIRNRKVHLEDSQDCLQMLEDVRSNILGVGHQGLLNRMYQSFYEDTQGSLSSLKKAA